MVSLNAVERESALQVLKQKPLNKEVKLVGNRIIYPSERSYNVGDAHVELYWSPRYKQWVASLHEKLFDAYVYGLAIFHDDTINDLQLNGHACRKIIKAFHIPKNRISIGEIKRKNPGELRKLVRFWERH